MSFEFLKNMFLNEYTIILGVIILCIVIFLFEKKSIKIISRIVLNLAVIVCVLVRGVFLGYDFIIVNLISLLLLIIINTIFSFGLKNKKIYTSLISQIVNLALFSIITIGIIRIKRINVNFEELNDSSIKIIFSSLVTISILICNNITNNIIQTMDKTKVKTEDVMFKKLFKDSCNMSRELIAKDITDIVVIYALISFISILFMNNVNINEELICEMGIEILIIAFISIINIFISIISSTMFYSLINRRKEIYKKISDNKIDGKQRTLKI